MTNRADNVFSLPLGGREEATQLSRSQPKIIDVSNIPTRRQKRDGFGGGSGGPPVVEMKAPVLPKPPEEKEGAKVAPWPLIDKYPIIVGSALSLAYLSATYRLALTGYRREYVDALSELLERDPHLYAVLMQRVLTACGARMVLLPRDQSPRCKKIAEECQRIVDNIQGFRQSLATLVFSGIYFGLGACEIDWQPAERRVRGQTKLGWEPRKLNFIHSRRLNYPDPGSWEPRIWDQGQVLPNDYMTGAPTNTLYGLRIKDYPGQFITFAPQLHADYPTREGVGRIVAFWSALKTMGARGAAQFVERFSKPWAIATYATTSTGTPRAAEASASNNDVGAANAALAALGTGSLAGCVIPDSVKIELRQVTGSRSNIGHKDWIEICNRELSKGVLGQTDTTDGGGQGSRARAQVQKTGSDQIARLDVMLIADAFQLGLIDWIARLNWPNEFDKRPIIQFAVDPEPDPYGVVKLASLFATGGAPVDAEDVARTIGIRLVDKGDKKARPMVPVKPVDAYTLYPDLFEQPEETTSSAGASAPSDGSAEDSGSSDKKEDSEDDEENDKEEDEDDESEEDDSKQEE